MTTINSYSVALGLEASNYIKNSSLSRTETRRLTREINSARNPAENYALQLTRLQRAYKAGAIDQRTFNRLVDEQARKFNRAADSGSRYRRVLSGMTARLTGIAAAYISVGKAFELTNWSVKLAADAEQAQIAFEVLTKDAKIANRLLNDLRSFAARTPFQQGEIVRSAKSLLAFGVGADEITTKLGVMGNISSATGTRIEELAAIIGKMKVQGIIQAEELNQLAGRGINVFDSLAVQLGVTTREVKKMGSEGRITFEMLDKALTDLANNDFAGMTERQAESARGQWSTFRDEIERSGRIAGEELTKEAGVLSQMTDFLSKINTGWEGIINPRKLGERTREAFNQELGGLLKGSLKAVVEPAAAPRRPEIADLAGLAEPLASAINTRVGGAQMAGEGLLAGFTQVGLHLADSFKFNTSRVIQSQEQKLAPSLEMGSQEAYRAVIEAQQGITGQEAKKQSEKSAKQVSLLELISGQSTKQTSLLETQLEIWRDNGPTRRIR